MKPFIIILSFCVIVSSCFGDKNTGQEQTEKSENNTFDTAPVTNLRLSVLRSLKDVSECFGTFEGSCFLDKAEDALISTNKAVLEEADRSVETAREDKEVTKPSLLMKSINTFISELTDIFKDSISGLFRDGKEDDGDEEEDDLLDDEEEDNEDDEKTKDKKGKLRNIQEARGKKKKKKKAIIKLLLIGAVIATKIKLLLKVLAAHLQIKFLMIALASLLLNAIRFYVDLKKGHQPQKVIYYEHAQHQHHYDGGDEDWHSGWSRSYEDENNKVKTGQDVAYAGQKPSGVSYSRLGDKPNYSWNED
ncbi:hypothetical protein MML48_2g00000992 [Holotrichia oblita]|uniref:Uncharacterized protein n=1 Tax=Holotrichia oblita TaxID=644536 RepID=A0ACB9TLF0_HOLOL|nr:hypothetical protein MML48_2g00000992 [Holotrichia oblita]